MERHWWQRLPQRFLEEDAKLRALVKDGTINRYAWRKQPDGSLWLIADLLLGDETQVVELRFPERYPGECPAMRPIPYGKALSSHQFGGDGVLCLELGPDNWHSRYMAADLLVSAWKLLALEIINTIKPIRIPSRHVDTPGMDVRGSIVRAILGRTAHTAIANIGPIVECKCVSAFQEGALVFWITDVPGDVPLADVPPIIAARDKQVALAINLTDDADHPPSDIPSFRAYLTRVGVSPEISVAASGLVVFLQATRIFGYYIPPWETETVLKTVVIADYRSRSQERRPRAIAEAAGGARVGIVGLGSLGSKVAVSLARTGVTNFVLVDGDVFLPENVERHDADYGLVGLMKVEAAAARIRRVAAMPVSITTFNHNVADGSNPSIHSKTIEALASADLIIDAAANPDAFNFLADLVSEKRQRFAWGEVFAGGIGGYVAFAVPHQTPCPSCLRAAFHSHAAEWPPAPEGAPEPYAAAQADRPPIIATDADVTVIAGALATLALRLVTDDLDGQAPVTLIGLRRGWVFEHAFDTRTIRVRADDFSCPRCWSLPMSPDATLQEEVEQILNTHSNVNDSNQL